MDANIYPDDPFKSDITCAIVGMCGAILLMSLQCPLAKISRHLQVNYHWIVRYIYEDLMYIVAFSFLVLLWRGIWNLHATYVFPDIPTGSWICHICGTILLLMSQTLSYFGSVGCIPDGVEQNGGAFFPTQYLRVYLKKYYLKQ